MYSQIHFAGPAEYHVRSTAEFAEAAIEVSLRRMFKGPRVPGWSWFVELSSQVLGMQVHNALEMPNVREARRYLNSVVIKSPALSAVTITRVAEGKFKGNWFTRKKEKDDLTLLYFHGGGYSFYPRPYEHVIAMITLASKARTFALDYPLTPERRFPSQLFNALKAYRWLLDNNTDPRNLIVAGDSAGGNLILALLLAARDAKLPMPALAIALSPAMDFEASVVDKSSDWITRKVLLQWADWFCDESERSDPLVSPIRASLKDLPPIYIQAGRGEVLFESIRAFAERAKEQSADVVLESWRDMPHIFQVFGPDAPESDQALKRIGQVIDERVRAGKDQLVS